MTCPCPLSVGTLLAASAICTNSKAPGGPRIGRELAEHARKHALLATGCPESAEQTDLAPMDAPTSQSPTAPNFAPHEETR